MERQWERQRQRDTAGPCRRVCRPGGGRATIEEERERKGKQRAEEGGGEGQARTGGSGRKERGKESLRIKKQKRRWRQTGGDFPPGTTGKGAVAMSLWQRS